MRILIVHNKYAELGGEEVVVQRELELLEGRGHRTYLVEVENEQLRHRNPWGKMSSVFFSREPRVLIDRAIAGFEPEVMHLHNWMPRVVTAAFSAAKKNGIPVVQTLHNFRLVCLNGLLLRQDAECELCLRRAPLPGVRYGCYGGSRLQSAGAAVLQQRMRRAIRSGAGDALIALSVLQRKKLLESGWIPEERTWIKPNFVPGPVSATRRAPQDREGLLFVGRLSREKGLHVVLRAMHTMDDPPPLTVLGDGPERAALETESRGLPVTFWGMSERQTVERFMARAALLVFPSLWYEAMPLTTLEAMRSGLPAIVSSETGAAEAVGAGGWAVTAGDVGVWAEAIASAYRDLSGRADRAAEGRRRYERYYSPEASYRKLMEIYRSVLEKSAATHDAS